MLQRGPIRLVGCDVLRAFPFLRQSISNTAQNPATVSLFPTSNFPTSTPNHHTSRSNLDFFSHPVTKKQYKIQQGSVKSCVTMADLSTEKTRSERTPPSRAARIRKVVTDLETVRSSGHPSDDTSMVELLLNRAREPSSDIDMLEAATRLSKRM